jgi:hypothetical protein
MYKATLEFNLPEDGDDFRYAINGEAYREALHNIREDVRKIWKYRELPEDQFNLAKKVQDKSKSRNLNPDFILPMVMAESGFNPQARSPKDAYGLMQITADTADTYKCKDRYDTDQNIDCGLTILSDLVSKKKIGNDPYKVLTAYNAGPSTKYFNSGNMEDMPDETLKHLDRVSEYYGGSLPTVETGKSVSEPAPAEPPEDNTIKPSADTGGAALTAAACACAAAASAAAADTGTAGAGASASGTVGTLVAANTCAGGVASRVRRSVASRVRRSVASRVRRNIAAPLPFLPGSWFINISTYL